MKADKPVSISPFFNQDKIRLILFFCQLFVFFVIIPFGTRLNNCCEMLLI